MAAKSGLFRRFLLPLLLVAGVHILSSLIYNNAAAFSSGGMQSLLVGIFGPIDFVSLWFFALVGPPLAYFRGARFGERLAIAYCNPVIWIATVETRIACQYDMAELITFFFLPWTFGIVCVTALLFALAETACRLADRRFRQQTVPVFHPLVVAMMIAGLCGTYFGLIRGQEWVYMVVHQYARHFL